MESEEIVRIELVGLDGVPRWYEGRRVIKKPKRKYTKLSHERKKEIFESSDSATVLANRYGVSLGVVYKVKNDMMFLT